MKKSIKILTVGILSMGILAACGEEENKIEDKKKEVKVEQNEVENGKDEVSENVKDENKEGGSELDMPIDYNVLNGEVKKIEEKENGTKYIPIGSPEPNFAIVITESTKVYNAKGEPTEIKEGDKFVAYDKLNKPMIMIHPPQHSPEMVVIESEKIKMLKEKVKIQENGLTESGAMEINFAETTKIENLEGKKVKQKDVYGKNTIVFYDNSTKSIPAKVTPVKIIVLD